MKNSRVKHLKSRGITKQNMFAQFLLNSTIKDSKLTSKKNPFNSLVEKSNKEQSIHLFLEQPLKLTTKGYLFLFGVMVISLIFFTWLGLPEIVACLPGIILSVSVNNYIKSHNEKILRNTKSRK